MVFIGIEKDLNSCWLAATCPQFFRELKSKAKVEEIILLKICTDMENVIRINLTCMERHVSLRVVINLLFGTVRIFQHQVQFLYDNVQFLASHSAIQWSEPSKASRKRQGIRLNLTSASSKKVRLSEVLSQDFLSQLSSVLDLNEEEKKILNTEETPQLSNQLCLPDISPPPSFRVDHLNSENFDDFGEFSLDDIDDFLSTSSSRKRRITDRSYDGESDCTEIFQVPTYYKRIIGCAGKTPTRLSRKRLVCSSDIELDELAFGENIMISSTPLRNSSKRARFERLEENLGSLDYTKYDYQRRSLKKIIPLKLDLNIKIKEERFVNQFNYASTLRHIAARDDIVTLFEMKKVSSNKLISTPCKSTRSLLLASSFKRNLIIKRSGNDAAILEEILGGIYTSDEILEVNYKSNAKRKRRFVPISDENISIDFVATEPASKKQNQGSSNETEAESETCMIIEKVKTISNSTWSRAHAFQLQKRHDVILKLLNKLWQQKVYPINMKTIHSREHHRKEMALIFLTIIELNAKGSIEIIKDSETNEIFHIAKKSDSRQTA